MDQELLPANELVECVQPMCLKLLEAHTLVRFKLLEHNPPHCFGLCHFHFHLTKEIGQICFTVIETSADGSLPTTRLLRVKTKLDSEVIKVLKLVGYPFPLMCPVVLQPVNAF